MQSLEAQVDGVLLVSNTFASKTVSLQAILNFGRQLLSLLEASFLMAKYSLSTSTLQRTYGPTLTRIPEFQVECWTTLSCGFRMSLFGLLDTVHKSIDLPSPTYSPL
jgi:hypothetical protein